MQNSWIRRKFPFTVSLARTLTGRWARRFFVIVLFFLLLITTVARLHSYFMVRRIESVLYGLSEMRLDQTTEEQMLKTVPFMTRRDWDSKSGSVHDYYVHISNESNSLMYSLAVILNAVRSERLVAGVERSLDALGYRFISFDARILVQNGKVSEINYGLANQVEYPRDPGYIGYLVSARSVHGFWLSHQRPLEITSMDDGSPQYRPSQYRNDLNVIYTNDVSTEISKRVFRLNLNCFWKLNGCKSARDIVPEMWSDAQAIQEAAYQRLISDKCPDSIIEGRMRYLPDVSVLLLEVIGSRRVEVNEEGSNTEDWFTDYKLKEVIRGRSSGSWKNIRSSRTIPSPMNPEQQITNPIWPSRIIGSQILYFRGLNFDSCRFIPATPTALAIVRNTPMPVKYPEDEIPHGLM